MARRIALSSTTVVVSALVALFGLGCDAPSDIGGPTPPTCSDVSGLWHVAIAYENLTSRQDWSIAEAECTLTLTGAPADRGGLGLDATPQTGSAWEGSFGAHWDKTAGPCPVHCSFDATLSGTTFAGSIFWIESPCNGYPGNSGLVPVEGSR